MLPQIFQFFTEVGVVVLHMKKKRWNYGLPGKYSFAKHRIKQLSFGLSEPVSPVTDYLK